MCSSRHRRLPLPVLGDNLPHSHEIQLRGPSGRALRSLRRALRQTLAEDRPLSHRDDRGLLPVQKGHSSHEPFRRGDRMGTFVGLPRKFGVRLGEGRPRCAGLCVLCKIYEHVLANSTCFSLF